MVAMSARPRKASPNQPMNVHAYSRRNAGRGMPMNRVKRVSFVVRVIQERGGEVCGVIERVATGAKEAFTGVETIGQVITRMLPTKRNLPRAGAGPPSPRGEKACTSNANPFDGGAAD
jgi:hypothetical protein